MRVALAASPPPNRLVRYSPTSAPDGTTYADVKGAAAKRPKVNKWLRLKICMLYKVTDQQLYQRIKGVYGTIEQNPTEEISQENERI